MENDNNKIKSLQFAKNQKKIKELRDNKLLSDRLENLEKQIIELAVILEEVSAENDETRKAIKLLLTHLKG